MTVIAGVVSNGSVYMAADSGASCDSSIVSIKESKLFSVGRDDNRIIVGAAGSARIFQLLKYHLKVRKPTKTESPLKYLSGAFTEQYARLTKSAGDGPERPSELLIGFRGRLFEMGSDFSLIESTFDFAAIGSGADFALGVLYATAGGADPKLRLTQAVHCAAKLSPTCALPMTTMSLETVAKTKK